MDGFQKTMIGLFIISSLFLSIWGVYITNQQMDFTDECIRECLNRNITDCSTEFFSLPWSNVNGRCIHNNITMIELSSKQEKIK
jgi:hypothetical protein